MVYHFCPIKSGLDSISGPKFTFIIEAFELFSWSQSNMLFESSGCLGFIKTGEDPLVELLDELFEIEGELFLDLE